jgi:hypothetical protein
MAARASTALPPKRHLQGQQQIQGPSPFDCAQGWDDDEKLRQLQQQIPFGMTTRKATAKAKANATTKATATAKCGDPSLRSG